MAYGIGVAHRLFLDRLREILCRAGLPVSGITARGPAIQVCLRGIEDREIQAEYVIEPKGGAGGARGALHVRTPHPSLLTEGENRDIKLLDGVMQRLDSHFPAHWVQADGPADNREDGENGRLRIPADELENILQAKAKQPFPLLEAVPSAVSLNSAEFRKSIARSVAMARRNGIRVQVIVPITRSHLSSWDSIVELAGLLEVSQCRDPDPPLAFEWVNPGMDYPDPLPFDVIEDFPWTISSQIDEQIPLRSTAGYPLCRFWRRLHSQLFLKPDPASGTFLEMDFGPGCADCALRSLCSGVSRSYATAHGFSGLRPFSPPPWMEKGPSKPEDADWACKVWWLLVNRPYGILAVRDILPGGTCPGVACELPWLRLEIHDGGTFGPCCSDNLVTPGASEPGKRIMDIWKGPFMRSVRRAISTGEPRLTCRTNCPFLVGGPALQEGMFLRGGSPNVVLTGIERVRDLFEAREVPSAPPAVVCFSATSWCNFDCLMCWCGADGSQDTQPDDSFYDELLELVLSGTSIEVNGGEPLVAPRFRAFLDRLSTRDIRTAPVSLITNGSLLTPDVFDRWAHLFRGLTVSLNAATPDTYLAVNRGTPWARVRSNLDHILEMRRDGGCRSGVTYSMVILQRNLEEIPAFLDLALRDGVDVRFMLQNGNRNNQSILAHSRMTERAQELLQDSVRKLEIAGKPRQAAIVAALIQAISIRAAVPDPEPLPPA